MGVAPRATGYVIAVAGAVQAVGSRVETHLAGKGRGGGESLGSGYQRVEPVRLGKGIGIQQHERIRVLRRLGRDVVRPRESDVLAKPDDLRISEDALCQP